MTTRPPWIAARLLSWRLAPEWRDFVLGDLEEEFRARSAGSPSAARLWYWRQAFRCVLRPPAASGIDHDVHTRDPFMFIRTLPSDLRHAVRVLTRTPSFSIAVIAVLALGIGANVGIFSIVNAVLLRPLPFEDAQRIVRLFHVPPQDAFPGMPTFSLSPANFYDWKREARSFEAMAIYRFREFVLAEGSAADEIIAAAVGDGFFEATGVEPALGRVFLPEEDAPGRNRVVVLSDGFWKRQFGGARDVIGRTLRLNGENYAIVGVMPARFSVSAWGATSRDFWVPLGYSDEQRAVRENHNAQVVARLRPGVTVEQARAELEAISKRLEAAYPKENAGWGATAIPLAEVLVGDVRTSLYVLLGAVGLVLLIACANVGNLLFARALARRKEIAIRSALGAGRARVFQQLLVESLTLAAIGGGVGLYVAHLSLDAGGILLAAQLPRADEVSIDVRVVLFGIAASLVTGILAGALPALRAGGSNVNETLKQGGRNDSAVGVRTRQALIVCEVALSVVLLAGATLMVQSLLALRHSDAGFNPRDVLTLRVSLPGTPYDTPDTIRAFFDAALERIRAVPGVQAAGAIDDLPVLGGSQQPIVLEGRPELLPSEQPTVAVRKITPGYLAAMQIPILRGRDVASSDAEVMLVSQSAARLLWGDGDPIDRRVTLPLESRNVLKRVIGIVGDVKQGDLSDPAAPSVYELSREHVSNGMTLVLRTAVPPMSVAAPAGDVIRGMDPQQPVEDIRTMEAVLDDTLMSQRFNALILGLFAAVALTLASVGIYSVLSYIVRGRSREIGIRTALGARTADVVRLVVIEGMTPALVGIAAGVVGAIGVAGLLESILFGVSATDPATLGAVAAGLTLVALLATLVPAYRASRVDPLMVLRGD
jgi:predicted permease